MLKGSFKLEEGYNSSVVAAQAIKVKNALTGSVHMEPEVKAAWDALLKSGKTYKEAENVINDIRMNYPEILEKVSKIISSVGYQTGLSDIENSIEKYYQILNTVSREVLIKFGWNTVNDDTINSLNDALVSFNITNKDSIKLFLVTCAEESAYGKHTMEIYSNANYREGKIHYKESEKGVGYIQLTWEDSQRKFINRMGGNCSNNNTAEFIDRNYEPWYVSAYVWDELKDCNKICEQYGFNDLTFVYTQYEINGWPKGAKSVLKEALFNGDNIQFLDNSIEVGGYEFRFPNGWNERVNAYNKMKSLF